MATYTNTWKNKAWFVWFVVQVPLILCKFPIPLGPDARSGLAGSDHG